MNRADFQRNFQWSCFGLVFNHKTFEYARLQGCDLVEWGVRPGDVVPCTQPVINAGETYMKAIAIVPDATGQDAVQKSVVLPWKNDIDEDPTFMIPGVPVTGMIQGKHTAWYMSRQPARDTPRGYCPKYTRCNSINNSLLVAHDVSNGSESLRAWRVYNKRYHTWNTAIDNLERGELIGAALDKFLALGLSSGCPHIQIFYKNKGPVGYLIDGTPYIYPENSTYTLREYVRKIAGVMPEVKAL
jgi:hypothetical protein